MEGPLSKRLSKSKPKNSGRNRGKPSFLTNKRVQVPQSPISTETPVRQAKNEHRKLKTINELMNNSSSSPHGQQLSNGKRSPNLSPFFWLQDDEDVEKPSQPLEMDHLTGTPAKAPSFSDIKDSDDDVPSKMSPRVCKAVHVCSCCQFQCALVFKSKHFIYHFLFVLIHSLTYTGRREHSEDATVQIFLTVRCLNGHKEHALLSFAQVLSSYRPRYILSL